MVLPTEANTKAMADGCHRQDLLARYLETEEAESSSCVDFIALRNSETFALNSNRVWREMVCKWGYDVVDRMGEDRSVVYVAMNILDRFCAMTEEPINEKRYECASLTALFLAIRVAGNCTLQTTDLLQMSRENTLKVQDIKIMAKQMQTLLTWDLRIIPPIDFIRAMMDLLPPPQRTSSLFESACFLSEIAVCDSFVSKCTASQIAFCSLLNASDGWLTDADLVLFCHRMKQTSSLLDVSLEATTTIRARLASIYDQVDQHNYNHGENESCTTAPRYISDDEEE